MAASQQEQEQSQGHLHFLPKSSISLIKKPLTQDLYEKAVELILEAEKRGDNVAKQELPDVDFLKLILMFGPGWTFHNVSAPDKLEAVVLIVDARFARSQHRTLCSIYIYTSPNLATRQARSDLMGIAQAIVPTLNRGYTAAVVEVFVTCLDHLLGYEQDGFVVTCVVPKAGQLAGQKGYINSYILYKRLFDTELPIPLEKRPFYAQKFDDFELSFAPLPPYLPCKIKLKCGKPVIIRPMTLEDVPKFYQAVQDAAREGKGYGSDELESYNYFCRWYVHEWECLTIEEADGQKRTMGYITAGGSVYSRSYFDSCISDSSIIILPEFRGGGIGAQFGNFGTAVARECGFVGGFADTAIHNLPSIMGNAGIGFVNTGVIPRGISIQGKGWVSLITFYRPFNTECDSLIEQMKKGAIRAKL